MNITTIVLVPSLWMTALCWEHWVKHYSDKGYCVVARSWPGMEGDIEQLRRDPGSFASLGLADVVNYYEQIIRELETPPIIIGHGLGGLVTQILLGTLQAQSIFGTTRTRHCSWLQAAKIAWCRLQSSKRISTVIENRKPKPITKNSPTRQISRSFSKQRSRTTCSVGPSVSPT